MKDSDKTLYVLDSYGLIYRAYYAFISRPLVNIKGENVSAVFGFFRNFLKILKDYKPAYAVAALDSRTPTFRHKLFDEYKATRQKTPDDLHAQIPVIEEILTALGIPILRCDGYEADDIIATLARECEQNGMRCCILSGDKDLMQLVNGSISILKPNHSGGWTAVDEKGVMEEWGVQPSQMQDMLSLLGDTADNIPGVKGIGEKTAQKLLSEYGTLANIYENVESIAGSVGKKLVEGKESAFFSKKLVELCTDVPVSLELSNYSVASLDFASAARHLFNAGVPVVAKSYAEFGAVAEVQAGAASVTSEEGDEPVFDSLVANTGDYRAVTDINELKTIIDQALAAGFAAFDCESNSLNPHEARLAGFSISMQKGKAVYIPLVTAESGTLGSVSYISAEAALGELARMFGNTGMTVITHNGKYDYEVLRANGLKELKCRFVDTMVAAWLLNPERASFSLEALSETQLGLKTIPFTDLVPKKEKEMTFFDVPLEKAVPYAAEDADLTLQLWQLFEPKLKEKGLLPLFEQTEMPVMPILAEMEIAGIRLDTQNLAAYGKELAAQIEDAEKSIFSLVGHEFNIASTKQLQDVLFEERKLVPVKKTKTGFSTDTAVLEELARVDEVPQKILEYRTLTKLQSTYVEAIPKLVSSDGRVRTSFIQTGTATGRLSSRDPNLQNIPVRDEAGRKIRSAFTACEGCNLVSADYSQIELVILAHLSGDENLKKAFLSGVDVHKATACLIFGVDAEAVTPDMRRTAKTINFGVMYGMSAFRLANELGISNTQAKSFIDSYFATYSGVQSFIHSTVEHAEEKGFVETIFGRRRYIQNINSKNKIEKSAAERVAVNTPIQGSAADIVKKAMIAVDAALKKENLHGQMLLQVHDELILECPESETEKVSALVKREMEQVVALSVPLKVSVESGKNWGLFH